MLRTWLTPHGLAMLVAALAIGGGSVAWLAGNPHVATLVWGAGVVPALLLLVGEIGRQLWRREPGVDIIAGLSMGGALALGETLAGVVIALMFTGGNVLDEFAQRRAQRELTALLGRTPRTAHREAGDQLAEVPVEAVRAGDRLVVKSGEVLPVDGTLLDAAAVLDELALTGESVPVEQRVGAGLSSGTLNAGAPFRYRADTTAADGTYAGIVRLVQTAQQQKAPFVRLANRWSLVFLAVTLAMAALAWLLSGDAVRSLAVLVVATPCPLILAVPVAIMAGISAAARHGVLIKGGGALETLARARTVMFDKTGTLTTGIARLTAVDSQDGLPPDELLRLAASLEQLSQHVLARAIIAAAACPRPDRWPFRSRWTKAPATGIEGTVDGRRVRLGGLAWVGRCLAAGLGRSAGRPCPPRRRPDRVRCRRRQARRRLAAGGRDPPRDAARAAGAAPGGDRQDRDAVGRPAGRGRDRGRSARVSTACWPTARRKTRSMPSVPSGPTG